MSADCLILRSPSASESGPVASAAGWLPSIKKMNSICIRSKTNMAATIWCKTTGFLPLSLTRSLSLLFFLLGWEGLKAIWRARPRCPSSAVRDDGKQACYTDRMTTALQACSPELTKPIFHKLFFATYLSFKLLKKSVTLLSTWYPVYQQSRICTILIQLLSEASTSFCFIINKTLVWNNVRSCFDHRTNIFHKLARFQPTLLSMSPCWSCTKRALIAAM